MATKGRLRQDEMQDIVCGWPEFGFPMTEVAQNTLKVYSKSDNDVAFLRFVEGNIYLYSYQGKIGTYME